MYQARDATFKSEYIRNFSPCNQDCLFCNGTRDFPIADTDATKKEILDLKRNQGVEKIFFSGGEPTLRKDLVELISFCKENGLKQVEICTNAIKCADLDFTSELRKAGADSAFVALHSYHEPLSDTLTRAPGTFKKTIKGIHTLHAEGINLTLNIVINAFNYRFLPEYVDFVHNTFPFVEQLCLSFVQCGDTAMKNSFIIPELSKTAPFLKTAYLKCIEYKLHSANPHCGVPVCFVPEFRFMSEEFVHLCSRSEDMKKDISTNKREKVKPKCCKDCIYTKYCMGFWRNYFKLRGAGEFRPVTREIKPVYPPPIILMPSSGL